MPRIQVVVAGRSFEVTCQSGEEPSLLAAAAILDAEAGPVSAQMGPMPDAQRLLMAGLMLADTTAALREQLREAQARVAELEARAAEAPREIEVPVEVPVEVRVEVPVLPPEVAAVIGDLAAEAEALARAVLAVAPERFRSEEAVQDA